MAALMTCLKANAAPGDKHAAMEQEEEMAP